MFSDVSFEDATYGNGDGVLDPGERIEVFVDLENPWRDAIRMLVTMTSPVPGVEFGESQVAFPLVLRGEHYDNRSAPFDFTIAADLEPINARFDFAFVTATPLAEPDSAVYTFLGGVDLLLVDDDDDSQVDGRPDWSHFYRNALDSLFIPYEYWDVNVQGTPGSTELGYRNLIWYTGNTYHEHLSSAEVAFLSGYLDGGGQLFLTGQDIAEQLSVTADSVFLRDYLKVAYDSTFADLDVYGIPGNPLSASK